MAHHNQTLLPPPSIHPHTPKQSSGERLGGARPTAPRWSPYPGPLSIRLQPRVGTAITPLALMGDLLMGMDKGHTSTPRTGPSSQDLKLLTTGGSPPRWGRASWDRSDLGSAVVVTQGGGHLLLHCQSCCLWSPTGTRPPAKSSTVSIRSHQDCETARNKRVATPSHQMPMTPSPPEIREWIKSSRLKLNEVRGGG